MGRIRCRGSAGGLQGVWRGDLTHTVKALVLLLLFHTVYSCSLFSAHDITSSVIMVIDRRHFSPGLVSRLKYPSLLCDFKGPDLHTDGWRLAL